MESTVKNNLLNGLTALQDTLAPQRTAALQSLEKLGLPTTKTEEYKHTAITRLLEKNFQSLATTSVPSDLAVNPFLINDLDAHVIVFVNGVYRKSLSNVPHNGFTIKPLEQACQEDKALMDAHLTKLADANSDAFVALNTATWNHGLFIHVSANTLVEKPIILHHITDASSQAVVTAGRNLVLIESNSEVTLIEKYDSAGLANFSTTVNEIVVAQHAKCTYTLLQNDAGKRFQFNQTVIQQASNSVVNCFTLSLNGKAIRNNLQLILDGEHCDSHMYGLYLLTNDTLADNHTVADHRQPNSQSNELYKGVMDGNSKGVFNGKIYVRPHAQKTNAFQSNRNIILSENASVNTKPQLEIWADDVKCSHGCTTGQLDEEALFYLQSRGISKDISRSMLLYAYAGEVIEKIELPALRTYIDELVSERLHKNF